MKIIQLSGNEDSHIKCLSILHKKSFKETIATTLMTNNLARLYRLLIKNKIISVNVAFDENKTLIGAITVKTNNYKRKKKLVDILKIIFLLLQGLLLHPVVWIREYYYKIGLYKGIDSKINIITLFVDTEYQDKGVGKNLIRNIKDQYKTKISIDTRTDNQMAIDFYLKNGFVLKNQNLRNTSFYTD